MQRPLPVRQTAWAVSKWRSCSKRKFSQELRPFIQPDLLPSDWRIVCCSLSFSLSSPCTAVRMHHRLSGLHMYTPTLPLQEWQIAMCTKKNTLCIYEIVTNTQRVVKIILHYPASKWGRSDRIHTLCFYATDHMAKCFRYATIPLHWSELQNASLQILQRVM